eukprot:15437324-Alexandrium_andersonii.AAC.1
MCRPRPAPHSRQRKLNNTVSNLQQFGAKVIVFEQVPARPLQGATAPPDPPTSASGARRRR